MDDPREDGAVKALAQMVVDYNRKRGYPAEEDEDLLKLVAAAYRAGGDFASLVRDEMGRSRPS